MGELQPSAAIPRSRVSYSINRAKGSVSVDINGSSITIRFVTNWDLFDDLYAETVEFIQSFLAVQSLKTGLPLQLVINEWTETPLESSRKTEIRQPVRGRVFHEAPTSIPIPADEFAFALAEGIRWSEDMEWSPFLRRAVLDFNYALQHPIDDIPIYLYRVIESAEAFFGGEAQLIKALGIKTQIKLVKRLADDANAGIHARHAATTPSKKSLSPEEVIKAADATREILAKFQMEVWSLRMTSQRSKAFC